MSENLPTSFQLDTNQNGSVTFATDVIATIAALAANEVEGVASMSPTGGGSLADILVRRGQPSRNLTKGVKVDVTDGRVSVHVSIIVDYGCPVPEVAANLQENVKKAVETMSGLTVDSVDVHVQGVSFERENRAAAEIEMRQRVLLTRQSAKSEPNKDAPAEAPPSDSRDDLEAEHEQGLKDEMDLAEGDEPDADLADDLEHELYGGSGDELDDVYDDNFDYAMAEELDGDGEIDDPARGDEEP